MIESDAFVQALQDIGVDFFTGVPDSILGSIIAELMERRLYTPAVREDEAVAMAADPPPHARPPNECGGHRCPGMAVCLIAWMRFCPHCHWA